MTDDNVSYDGMGGRVAINTPLLHRGPPKKCPGGV